MRHELPGSRRAKGSNRGVGGAPATRPMYDIDPGGDQRGAARGVTTDRPLSYAELSGEPTFDPLSNSRFLWQVARQAALFAGLYFLAEIAIGIVCLLLGFIGLGLSNAVSLWSIIGAVASVVLAILFWLTPIPALLGQQSRLLRFGSSAAPMVLAGINQTIINHATPYDTLRNRTMSPPGEGRREYLELRRGFFSGMISCFSHGQDLYIGWTFWVYLSPLKLMFMFIGRWIQNRTGRGNDMYQTLRYDSVRATIAAIHSSVVEIAEKVVPQTGPIDELGEVSGTDSSQESAPPERVWESTDQVRERSPADGDRRRDQED